MSGSKKEKHVKIFFIGHTFLLVIKLFMITCICIKGFFSYFFCISVSYLVMVGVRITIEMVKMCCLKCMCQQIFMHGNS